MPLITRDDFIETYIKVYQRGASYLFSKLNPSASKRTISTFDDTGLQTANYWIIPAVRRLWNRQVSGKEEVPYEQHVYDTWLKEKKGLRLLSLGSGISSHETVFASFPCFEEVKCVDFAPALMEKARFNAESSGLRNMTFEAADVNKMELSSGEWDIILFHSSLHHFRELPQLLNKVKAALKPDGLLIINEYVGPRRLQHSPVKRKAINSILHEIPEKYRRRFKTGFIKRNVSGPGLLRMLVTDPSEAVESDLILPLIHERFTTREEKGLAGTLLMPLLKDLAHHFMDEADPEAQKVLHEVINKEEVYLHDNPCDFIFGVYSS